MAGTEKRVVTEKTRSAQGQWDISVLDIVSNNNPRHPLSHELQEQGWTLFHGEKPIWELAASPDVEKRAEFVKLIDDHDPEIRSLAVTLITQGQLQPVEVRESGSGTYALVFGARRCLARLYNWCVTGKPAIPKIRAVLFKGNDGEAFHRSITENVRKAASPIEEAVAWQRMLNNGETKAQIAENFGVSVSTIENRLKLLKLPEKEQQAIHTGAKRVSQVLGPASSSSTPHGDSSPPPPCRLRPRKEVEAIRAELGDHTYAAKLLDWVLGKIDVFPK